jgi:hypothetical protein
MPSINASGQVTANVQASCTATHSTFTLKVTDNQNAMTTATLTVNVTANTVPTLSYANQRVQAGSTLMVNPVAGPSDNGNITSISVINQGNYTGTISVNTAGVISLTNAAPIGTHTITIRATDNCGAANDASFTLTIAGDLPGPGLLPNATSTISDQKPGSVLFYNLFTSDAANSNAQNTRISLTNTHSREASNVHLFFVDGASCAVADSYICLTPNQTVTFLASDVDPGTTGYLVAVATNPGGCPINFNYLIGDEFVKLSGGHAANLAAEAISAIAGNPAVCDPNTSTMAELKFDGVSYNTLPRTLALSNVGSRADGNDTLLVVNRLGGNLSTGAITLNGIFGILYDDAESPFSFNLQAPACQLRVTLNNNLRLTPRFEAIVPAGRSAWLKLNSAADAGILGAALNRNANAVAGAFNQGHNLHKLTLTSAASVTIPVFPPSC